MLDNEGPGVIRGIAAMLAIPKVKLGDKPEDSKDEKALFDHAAEECMECCKRGDKEGFAKALRSAIRLAMCKSESHDHSDDDY